MRVLDTACRADTIRKSRRSGSGWGQMVDPGKGGYPMRALSLSICMVLANAALAAEPALPKFTRKPTAVK